MTAKKIALFIDADNISAKFGKQIFDVLERRGEIFIRRIYGNWEKISLHGWNDCILSFSLRAVQQPDFATGKNATDMSLTIDAMDVLHDGKAEVFALVSNDSDFTPLAIRLREGGMTVIGLGGGQVSNSFRAACSEFIDLSASVEVSSVQPPAVVKKTPPAQAKSSAQMSLFVEEDNTSVVTFYPPPVAPSKNVSATVATSPKVISIDDRKLQSERDKKIQQLHNVLHESATVHADAAGFSSINYARQALKNKNFKFTVHDFGYGQLKDFIVAFPKLYETQQDDAGQNFRYRCRTIKPKEISAGTEFQKLHDALREAATLYNDDTGFVNLGCAGNALANKNLTLKGSGHSTLSKFVAAFPNLYELKQSGGAIYYRCLANAPKIPVAGDEFQQVHAILREAAATYKDLDDLNGYTALNRAGLKAHERKLDIKNFGYSSWSKFVSDFPKLYVVKKVGTIIYYRCR